MSLITHIGGYPVHESTLGGYRWPHKGGCIYCPSGKCVSVTDHITNFARMVPPSAPRIFFVEPSAAVQLLAEMRAGFMAIGTGPWPDADDTGDPPSTKPMGWSLPKRDPTPGIDAWAPKKKSCGAKCCKCKTFNEYAEPNQKDGSYICFECR